MWRVLVPALALLAVNAHAVEPPRMPAQALGPLEPLMFNRGPAGGDIPAGCMPLALRVDAQGAVVDVQILQSSRLRQVDMAIWHGVRRHRFDPALLAGAVDSWRVFVNWSINGRSGVLADHCAPIGEGHHR